MIPWKVIAPLLMEQLPAPSVMEMLFAVMLTMLLPESTFTPLLVICTFLSGRLSCPTISPEDASNERKFVAVLAASATAASLDFL